MLQLTQPGANIHYGPDGFDDAATQSMAGLLRLPLRPVSSAAPSPTS